MFILNFIVGILIAAGGVAMLKFNYQLGGMFGSNGIITRRMGPGSIYLLLKIVALLVIFAGFLVMFSLHDNFIGWFFGPVFRALGFETE